ncbi:hypothetical protein [Mesorhizobium sp. WSM2239]|uniref:Uncharacterized protein n=2 Tax=unclassified Mesorhizobium TaxID=325217 RepID=A0AAU8DCK7_9HYPH
MTLQSSGPMSFADIRAELGMAPGAPLTIPSPETRALTGVASGPIVIPTDFYGKSYNPEIAVSLVDHKAISTLPASISLGAAASGRLIIIAYMNGAEDNGSVPTDTALTLGGAAMTRVPTLFSYKADFSQQLQSPRKQFVTSPQMARPRLV